MTRAGFERRLLERAAACVACFPEDRLREPPSLPGIFPTAGQLGHDRSFPGTKDDPTLSQPHLQSLVSVQPGQDLRIDQLVELRAGPTSHDKEGLRNLGT